MAGAAAIDPIIHTLAGRPGLGVMELVQATGKSRVTVMAALEQLQTQSVIRVVRGSKKAHFLTGLKPLKVMPQHLVSLFVEIRERGPMTAIEAARLFPRVPEITTRHRLHQLVRRGHLRMDSSRRYCLIQS